MSGRSDVLPEGPPESKGGESDEIEDHEPKRKTAS